jgi:hypothetical protein
MPDIPSSLKCCVLGTLGRLGYCLEKGKFLVSLSAGNEGSLLFLRLMRPEVPDAVCEGAVRFDPSGGIDVLEDEYRRWCAVVCRSGFCWAK